VIRYTIDSKRSRLWALARSSLHPIRVETDGLEGYLDAESADGGVRLGLPIHVELETALIRSGNALLDRELERHLEVRKYRRVIGEARELEAVDPASGRHWVRGDLTLHGVTRVLDAQLSLRTLSDGMLELAGERTIDMRDFGLTPPKLFIFRVYPEVQLRLRLVVSLSRS
jgi:polyisoprenoid-binding protein YceI